MHQFAKISLYKFHYVEINGHATFTLSCDLELSVLLVHRYDEDSKGVSALCSLSLAILVQTVQKQEVPATRSFTQ